MEARFSLAVLFSIAMCWPTVLESVWDALQSHSSSVDWCEGAFDDVCGLPVVMVPLDGREMERWVRGF